MQPSKNIKLFVPQDGQVDSIDLPSTMYFLKTLETTLLNETKD